MIARDGDQDDEVFNIDETKPNKSILKNNDLFNIIFLLFLYVILAIPFGVALSIPLILSSRKVSYSDQGTYSFVSLSFSIKLLWAPLLDAFSIKRIGRRKTWIVTCQFLMGVLMVSLASFVNTLIDSQSEHKKTDIYYLTLIFGAIVFLSATQDTALDAWSLDLLMEKNAPFQALCNSIGMGIGQFVGNAGFLIFESVNFSNNYIRPFFKLEPQKHGLVTIEKFFYVFGSVSIITSIFVLLFKNEYNLKKIKIESERLIVQKHEQESKNRSLFETYKIIWNILTIKSIRILIILVVTSRIAFSSEGVIRLKLIEEGFAREKLSLLGIVISPILTVIPIVLSKTLKGSNPLGYFRIFLGLRIISMLIFCVFLNFVSFFRDDEKNFSFSFYILLFSLSLVNGFLSFGGYLTLGGFNAKISDRGIGGTYMTFLAFWPNLGSNLSRTIVLFLIDLFTFKTCHFDTSHNLTVSNNFTNTSSFSCSKQVKLKECKQLNGVCTTLFDPFYIITGILLLFGVGWFIISKRYIKRIQYLPKSDWAIVVNK